MESRKRKADELDPSTDDVRSVPEVDPSTSASVPKVEPTIADSVPGGRPITADGISKVDPAMAAYIEKRRKEKDEWLERQGQALWKNYWTVREQQLSRPFGPLPSYPEVIEVWQRDEVRKDMDEKSVVVGESLTGSRWTKKLHPRNSLQMESLIRTLLFLTTSSQVSSGKPRAIVPRHRRG